MAQYDIWRAGSRNEQDDAHCSSRPNSHGTFRSNCRERDPEATEGSVFTSVQGPREEKIDLNMAINGNLRHCSS